MLSCRSDDASRIPTHATIHLIRSLQPNQGFLQSSHDKYFPTIGTLLPIPKALLLTRMMGQNWFLLYSFVLTSFSTLLTNASCMPRQMISLGPWRFSIY